jgi:hypothetical protein
MNNIKYPFKIYVFFICNKNIHHIFISHLRRSNQELRSDSQAHHCMLQFAPKTIPVPLQRREVEVLLQTVCSNPLPVIQSTYVRLLQTSLPPTEHFEDRTACTIVFTNITCAAIGKLPVLSLLVASMYMTQILSADSE